MSAEMKLKVVTMGGEEHEIESPIDIRTEDFISDLVGELGFPLRDAEGNPVVWRIDNKDTARTLEGRKTLEENGVRDGHRLLLLRDVIAGS